MAQSRSPAEHKRIVIIGGNACGMKAASRLRRRNPDADITVVERGSYLSYGACGFPYYIAGMVKDYKKLIDTPAGVIRDSAFFEKVKGVCALTKTEAVGIDRTEKKVIVRSAGDGAERELPYDACVIATGGSPAMPDIEGCGDLQGCFTVSTMDDAVGIRSYLDSATVSNVVISGGGFIGIETAEGFLERDLNITIVKKSTAFLPAMFDEEMSLLLMKYMKDKGISIITGEDVVRVEADGRGRLAKVFTESGAELDSELLLITKGLQPNVQLAQNAGLAIGATGCISVNGSMQTSDPAVYAGGDCVETTHMLSGDSMNLAMGSIANIHGRIIADCISGDDERFPGVLGTGIFKLFDYTVARTGLTEREARERGHDVVSAIVPGGDKPHFFRGAKPVTVKLISERLDGKLLGAQIVGRGEVAKRIDIAATALTFGATVDQVSKLNLAYSPPYSPALDNIITAANVMKNKIAGLARGVSPLVVKQKFDRDEDFIYLDVRSPQEFEHMRIDHPAVMLAPLGTLRSSPPDIPRDKEIIISCMSSLRAYEAQRILESQGFSRVAYMDGGLMAWPYDLHP